MGLADPHIGVQTAMIQAIAVALLLRLFHDLAQPVGAQELLLPQLQHLIFKFESGVDIADDLRLAPELIFQQAQPFFLGGSLGYRRGKQQALIEGGGSFRHRHSIAFVQRAMMMNTPVVIGMAQFMSQCTNRT